MGAALPAQVHRIEGKKTGGVGKVYIRQVVAVILVVVVASTR